MSLFLERSAGYIFAKPPELMISTCRVFNRSSDLAVRRTFIPFAASDLLILRPIPLLAPVISAILFFNSVLILTS
jgi:hypothetical protein